MGKRSHHLLFLLLATLLAPQARGQDYSVLGNLLENADYNVDDAYVTQNSQYIVTLTPSHTYIYDAKTRVYLTTLPYRCQPNLTKDKCFNVEAKGLFDFNSFKGQIFAVNFPMVSLKDYGGADLTAQSKLIIYTGTQNQSTPWVSYDSGIYTSDAPYGSVTKVSSFNCEDGLRASHSGRFVYCTGYDLSNQNRVTLFWADLVLGTNHKFALDPSTPIDYYGIFYYKIEIGRVIGRV